MCLWIDFKRILDCFIWSYDVCFDLFQISLSDSFWIQLPNYWLPNRFLALTIVRITNVIFLDPSIETSSWNVNVFIRIVLLGIRSFITLLMIKSIDSEVTEIGLCTRWKDVISGSIRCCVEYSTCPSCFNKAFVTTSVSILKIPIIAEQLFFIWIWSIVSTVSTRAWNIVITCISCRSSTINVTSSVLDYILRPSKTCVKRMFTVFKRTNNSISTLITIRRIA